MRCSWSSASSEAIETKKQAYRVSKEMNSGQRCKVQCFPARGRHYSAFLQTFPTSDFSSSFKILLNKCVNIMNCFLDFCEILLQISVTKTGILRI